MTEYVVDTHALYWHLVNPQKLGAKAAKIFSKAASGEAVLLVSVITLAELRWLNEKLGNVIDFEQFLRKMEDTSAYEIVPFLASDLYDLSRNSAVTEMHDRIIVGVARQRRAALITRDKQIVESKAVETVW